MKAFTFIEPGKGKVSEKSEGNPGLDEVLVKVAAWANTWISVIPFLWRLPLLFLSSWLFGWSINYCRKRTSRMNKIRKLVIYLVLILLSLLFLFPILWMAMTALKTPAEATNFLSFPSTPQWQNFVQAWQTAGFGDAFVNTFEIGVGTVLLSVAAGIPMAYSLVRYPVRGANLAGGSMGSRPWGLLLPLITISWAPIPPLGWIQL